MFCNIWKRKYQFNISGGIDLVKISDDGIDEQYDECDDLPCLVHFRFGKQAVVFYGDLKEDEEIQQWIEVESKKR